MMRSVVVVGLEEALDLSWFRCPSMQIRHSFVAERDRRDLGRAVCSCELPATIPTILCEYSERKERQMTKEVPRSSVSGRNNRVETLMPCWIARCHKRS